MSDGGYGPFAAWDPAQPSPVTHRWRPGWLALMLAAVAAVLLFGASLLVTASKDDGGPQREDPQLVAARFVQHYAVHDPAACELVTSSLRQTLDREARCTGPVRGAAPRLAVVSSQTCGTTHSFTALVEPPGEFGAKRFVSVGLEKTGTAWLVRSVLPVEDCRVLRPATCDGG